MARRKRKKSPSIFGALLVELFALVVFLVLFNQARAERKQESGRDNLGIPAIQGLLEQTPFRGMVAQNTVQPSQSRTVWNAMAHFGQE
jgi:hypothetical protein